MIRKLSIPPHIDALEHVHEEEEPDKDAGEISVDELDKDDGPFNKIESFGHVHHAAEDNHIYLRKLLFMNKTYDWHYVTQCHR